MRTLSFLVCLLWPMLCSSQVLQNVNGTTTVGAAFGNALTNNQTGTTTFNGDIVDTQNGVSTTISSNSVTASKLTINGTGANFVDSMNVSSNLFLSNATFSATAATRTFVHDGTHTVISNTATLTASEWTAGSQKEWYNGTATLTIDKTNGLITAIQYSATTNQATMAPNFLLAMQDISTNAAFTVLAPINVDQTKYERCTVYYTNSTAAAVAITLPASIHGVGTQYVTNITEVIYDHYGKAWTNATFIPRF